MQHQSTTILIIQGQQVDNELGKKKRATSRVTITNSKFQSDSSIKDREDLAWP